MHAPYSGKIGPEAGHARRVSKGMENHSKLDGKASTNLCEFARRARGESKGALADYFADRRRQR